MLWHINLQKRNKLIIERPFDLTISKICFDAKQDAVFMTDIFSDQQISNSILFF